MKRPKVIRDGGVRPEELEARKRSRVGVIIMGLRWKNVDNRGDGINPARRAKKDLRRAESLSGRQWVKLRKRMRREHKAAERAKAEAAKAKVAA